MTERRSNRAKASINYSNFGGGDRDDDDFTDPTPPARKLTTNTGKENKLQKKLKTKESSLTTSIDEHTKIRRPPPEDRLLDLQIKEALAASLQDSPKQEDNGEIFILEDKPVETSTQIPDNRATDREKNKKKSFEMDDSPPKKRQKNERKQICIESDSDGDNAESESCNDDDDDFNPNEEDSDIKKSKNKSKEATLSKSNTKSTAKSKIKTPKVTTKTTQKATTQKTFTPMPKPKLATPTNNRVSSVVCTPLSSAKQTPAWTPPGRASQRTSESNSGIKSPSGGIRLGLSRNQRVKSLHPSLTVQH